MRLTHWPATHPQSRTRSVLLVTGAAAALVLAQGAAALAAPAASQQADQQKPLTGAQAAQLSTNVNQHVIVFMKDEPVVPRLKSAAMSARSAVISASQQPLLSELTQVHATHVISYRLVNAVAATVSAGEEARLKANPDVSQVIPDATIQGPVSNLSGSTGSAKKPKRIKPIAGACLAHGKAQLEPEGLSLTGVASSNRKAKTARSLGISGAGETVAYIADGIDPNNVNFKRADGKSAITVYRDFTGDGTSAPSGAGGEAFGDANTIAGQGRHVYNVQNFSFQGLNQRCNIKIEGVAPGANIEALRVFGVNNVTTTSAFLDAINFASVVDPVNVINESFGENGFPDTSADAIKMFDDAAVTAGITVVVSSGDSAPTSTIGSPATDPDVISAAATTDLRSYAMSNYGQVDMFAKGWLNNSIAPFSSGGFDAFGNTVDVAAPGDSSFASCSTNLANFPDCASFGGKALGIELFGGTSESSPWTAGVAALIDQAYNKTHPSGPPITPAQVKQIIMSTATNLGAGAYEQGAGLVNAYQAVKMAESIGLSHRTGSTLLDTVTSVSPANSSPRQGQINGLGSPGTTVTAHVTVTNTGSSRQTVHLSGKALGKATDVQNKTLTLSNAHSKKFTDAFGFVNNYGELHFTVRPGQDRLSASIAYPAKTLNFNAAVRFDLINPKGKIAIQSEPQGTSNFTPADVLHPAAGRWTAVIFDMTGGKEDGTVGKIHFTASTQKLVSFGHVSTSVLHLASGASRSFTFTVKTPGSPGDTSGSVRVNSGSIPVTLRSMVNLATGGHFSGTLTGGNGREDLPGNGQINYYEFNVPAGAPNVSASVNLTNDGERQVNAYLVDPAGEIAGFGSNYLLSSVTSSGLGFSTGTHMDAYAANAIPGTWTLVVDFNDPVFATPSTGNETAQRYTGQIQLKSLVSASASTLPNSASTMESGPVTVPVTITNHGSATENFFLDPRLNSTTTYPLIGQNTSNEPVPLPVPLPAGSGEPGWLVPTETSELGASAVSTVPMTFDLGEFGDGADPDIASYTPGSTAGSTTPSLTVAASAGSLSPGLWAGAQAPPATDGFVTPDTTTGTANFTLNAMTQTFDLGALPDQGDFWYGQVGFSSPPTLPTFNPTFSIAPGQSKVINLTITPSQDGTVGTVVSGTLYVDVFAAFNEVQLGGLTGSDVLGIPYKYTIGS